MKQVLPDVTRDLESDCHNVTSVPHKETISVTVMGSGRMGVGGRNVTQIVLKRSSRP